MQASQTPTLVPLAFAANGTKNTIPEASQIGVTPGAASLNDGFPPLTFTPVAAGGVPPAGADFNGVLNLITQSVRWAHGGGRYAFSSTFAADANVSGYPAGAELMSADLQGAWLSLNDANTDNPDTGPGTKWVPSRAYGITAVTGLTNANATLTPAQAAKSRITLAGTLTANVQIIFPTWLREWTVINNTTGAFTVTAKTAAGTGVAIPQDGSPTKVVGDGTNITQPAENVAPATQSQHAVQMAQAAGVVGSVRNLKMYLSAASASATVTADEIIVETALGGVRYCLPSFSKTINLATTGAGGMDTGAAPVSGFVAIYAIYNPTTQTAALLATNASSLVANVYGGANMPSGYTASGLLAVVPTNASSQFKPVLVRDRKHGIVSTQVLNTSTASSNTTLSLSATIPANAICIGGELSLVSTASSAMSLNVTPDSNNLGQQNITLTPGTTLVGNFAMPIVTQQQIIYTASSSAGTPTFAIYIGSYEI
jgi:hypothetical protein